MKFQRSLGLVLGDTLALFSEVVTHVVTTSQGVESSTALDDYSRTQPPSPQ